MSVLFVSSRKRMAKNAIYLYIRTFVIMLVSLYTSRVVLQELGETDFGIYNVVGGITIMFSFVTNALTSATQRFMNVELGKGSADGFKKIFCSSMNLYFILVLIFIFLGETIGLWFLNTQLNIPAERMNAAMYVYQFSIVASCLTLLRIPYNASVIAYERMSFYAYISIIEAILKLVTVYLLVIGSFDNLIFYSILIAIVAGLILLCNYSYCKHAFCTCDYSYNWDKTVSKQLLSFSGWSIFGSASAVSANQGFVFILNIFFGVIVNTALGIANQVQSAINSFVTGFQTAFNPQLVKSYTLSDNSKFHQLIIDTSRFSFYLMLIPTIPLYIWCREILSLWLGNIPDYSIDFTRIIVVITFWEALSNPLFTSIQATGRIRKYQCWVSVIMLLSLPIIFLLLKVGMNPVAVMYVRMALFFCLYLGRLIHLYFQIKLPLYTYFKDVILKGFAVLSVSMIYPILTYGFDYQIIHVIITIVIILISVLLLGLYKNETRLIKEKIFSK